jgi:hypothetical protein
MVARVDLAAQRETRLSDLGPPTAEMAFGDANRNFAYRGFSLLPDGRSFLTSVYRAKMAVWLLEDFYSRTRLVDWLWRR